MAMGTARATGTGACRAIRIMAITMPDDRPDPALLRLMAWLSPAFPVGSFSYSHGLERAVHDGLMGDRTELEDWLRALIDLGSGWNDAVLLAEAHRRAAAGLSVSEVVDLAEALAGSAERHRESTLQGAAFIAAAQAWAPPAEGLGETPAYSVAVGAVAGACGIQIAATLAANLQAFAANIMQAAIRLGVTGQEGAVGTLAALEPLLLDVAARAQSSTLDDLGSATFISDVMAMKHETQYSRLFRS
jgi:urease accessory protein